MIKVTENRNNILAKQKDALVDYIDALVTEDFVQNLVAEKSVFRGENNNVRTLIPIVVSKKETLDEVRKETIDEQFIRVSVFIVSGLMLAIPCNKISNIIDLPDITILDDNKLVQVVSDLESIGSTTCVVITSLLVLPNTEWIKPNKVIQMKDSTIGFTCDAVIESLLINKNDVRWRTDNTKRKWLAGTVMKRQMAILDVDKIIEDMDMYNKKIK